MRTDVLGQSATRHAMVIRGCTEVYSYMSIFLLFVF